jgi:hypothetical protein
LSPQPKGGHDEEIDGQGGGKLTYDTLDHTQQCPAGPAGLSKVGVRSEKVAIRNGSNSRKDLGCSLSFKMMVGQSQNGRFG